MKYMIHTYPKRLWYVKEYLIPSMVEQGIQPENITIYNDEKGEGNLKACMNAFSLVDDNEESTWHLQDDVIICRNFREITEMYDNGLICGFTSEMYDKDRKIGPVNVKDMWLSFPCMCIPNKYARQCSEWITEEIIGNSVYRRFWMDGKNDDWAFRLYLKAYHKNDPALNLYPNIVDHIDYLLGGGSGGKRSEPCRSRYFQDLDLVDRLEKTLCQKRK